MENDKAMTAIYENSPNENKGLAQSTSAVNQAATADAATEWPASGPQPKPARSPTFGSDVELARLVADELGDDFGEVPYCEGHFWRYAGTHWEPIPEDEMRRRVQKCDGRQCGHTGHRVRLNKARIDSIVHEAGAMLSDPAFFDGRRDGINCRSGFISFDEGSPKLLPHDPAHRQRHTLQGRWEPGAAAELPEGSLLARLLRGSFEGDADANDKIDLLAEIAGAAALGYGPKHTAPKAVVLLGRSAENGKSQILDLLRGLLPPGAASSVPPSKFNDDRYLVKLSGKLLNTSDELGTARAIASEAFKAIVTGEPVMARDVFAQAIEFRPQAQHVFACNQLPAFQGGMDRGVLRRLALLVFNRTIPEDERVPRIGQRVTAEEGDLVLAWAVRGAVRLLARGHFPEPSSSAEALRAWAQSADPVLGWIEERTITGFGVVGEEPPRVTTRDAYEDFRAWAISEGYSLNGLPSVNTFSQRLQAAGPGKGIAYRHSGKFRGFVGLRLKPSYVSRIIAKGGAA
jgi:P4 family phage/plasmid primase-like protien